MSDNPLADRGRALEDLFFQQQDQALLAALKEQVELDERRAKIAAAAGITNETVIDELIALNLGDDTIAAVSLAPLVQVAWADGTIQPEERDALLQAAAESGLKDGTAGRQILQSWLENKPSDDLYVAWADYIFALSEKLSADMKQSIKDDILGRAKNVAEAAGGILGIGKTSSAEQQVLDQLMKAFG